MPIHPDWRSKIHDVLRAKRRKKLTGDYIQQSLDYFAALLPCLTVGREVVMKREKISEITNGEWSESSITKFFQHLAGTEVLDYRSAGASGIGVTLLRDLSESPWKSRRPSDKDTDVAEIPTDDDYSTSVDLDLTLEAIDAVSECLLGIDLSKLYEAQGRVSESIHALRRIKTALATGDDSDLANLVGRKID